MTDIHDLAWTYVVKGDSPFSPESEDAVTGAYKALLAYHLERDGEVTPVVIECPAAERLIERGEAHWKTCLTLGAGPSPAVERQ